jgi:hypothetical protein
MNYVRLSDAARDLRTHVDKKMDGSSNGRGYNDVEEMLQERIISASAPYVIMDDMKRTRTRTSALIGKYNTKELWLAHLNGEWRFVVVKKRSFLGRMLGRVV